MRYFSLLCLCIVSILGNSCSQSDAYKLRTFHASPNLGAFNLVVDDKEHANELSYGDVTDYKTVDKEILDYKGYDEQQDLIFAISHTFSKEGNYTLAVAGQSDNLDFIIIDDETVDLDSNKVAMRFWNGVQSSPAYDIYVTLPETNLNETSIDFSNFDYATASTYLKLSSGNYRIRITEPGSTVITVADETLSFSAGKVYTFALIEKAGGGTPYQLVMLDDD
ncbi:MAG TPA: DUF4397 domain-containing protein [Oligoflexia bacterium]|nr:DUF4397 domain-containing protein [Oligoflexia bacterium]HMR25691.1 DUF4397 domain-containing protein [Oligoflexia bacterium]